jgi:ankyrin repeat protein
LCFLLFALSSVLTYVLFYLLSVPSRSSPATLLPSLAASSCSSPDAIVDLQFLTYLALLFICFRPTVMSAADRSKGSLPAQALAMTPSTAHRYLKAAYFGHLSKLTQLLVDDPSLRNATNKRGESALLMSAAMGHISVVHWLLTTSGAANILDFDVRQRGALAKAAGRGHLSIVKLLLEGGFGGGAWITERDAKGNTAFLLSAKNGHVDVVRWLLVHGGANIRDTNHEGSSALILSAVKGHIETLQFLLSEGGASIAEVDGTHMSALLCAALNGRYATCSWLLMEGGASISEEDDDGDTMWSILDLGGGEQTPELVSLLRVMESKGVPTPDFQARLSQLSPQHLELLECATSDEQHNTAAALTAAREAAALATA